LIQIEQILGTENHKFLKDYGSIYLNHSFINSVLGVKADRRAESAIFNNPGPFNDRRSVVVVPVLRAAVDGHDFHGRSSFFPLLFRKMIYIVHAYGGNHMKKVLVIYHSQQAGNTKALAEAVGEGIRNAGAEAELVNTNEHRVTKDEFLSADAFAIGTPDYFSYIAGTIKTLFDDIHLWNLADEPVKGKPAVFFISHSGGGRVRDSLESFARKLFEKVGETIESEPPVDKKAKRAAFDLGKELVSSIVKKT
jgi:flavodoxin